MILLISFCLTQSKVSSFRVEVAHKITTKLSKIFKNVNIIFTKRCHLISQMQLKKPLNFLKNLEITLS